MLCETGPGTSQGLPLGWRVAPPSSSSHRQGQDAGVVLNYKQQANDLVVGYRTVMILESYV